MTSRGRTNPLVYVLAVLALILAGPAVADDGGAATIEELVEYCTGKTSLADLLPMVHPDDQPTMGFGIVMMGLFAPIMAMQDDVSPEEQEAAVDKITAEFEALQKKHGLHELSEDAPAGDTPEGLAMRARYTFDGVDIAAFMSDAEEWLMSVIKTEALGDSLVPDFTQFDDLQVDGDSATATLGGMPVEFIRDGGRWYLRLEL